MRSDCIVQGQLSGFCISFNEKFIKINVNPFVLFHLEVLFFLSGFPFLEKANKEKLIFFDFDWESLFLMVCHFVSGWSQVDVSYPIQMMPSLPHPCELSDLKSCPNSKWCQVGGSVKGVWRGHGYRRVSHWPLMSVWLDMHCISLKLPSNDEE